MATVSKQPNGRWLVRYWTPDGRQRKQRFDRQGEAKTFAAGVEADKGRGVFVDPRAGRTPIKDWAERWLDGMRPDAETGEGTIKPKTFASYESLLRSRVLPTFGRRRLSSVKPSDVQTWVNKMQTDGLSRSRVRQAHVLLKQIFDAAIRDSMIGRNPCLGVKLPKLRSTEAAYLEPAIVDSIADAIADPYGLLVSVLGVVGLRFGEAAALRRRHVDLLRRRLRVEDSLAEVSGRFVFGTTKSHATRSVPLPSSLADALSRHLDENVSADPDALLFTGPKGGPLRYRYMYMRLWRPALEGLALPAVGLHVLRHSAAARMIAVGASAKAVQSIMGHRSAAFTLTVYGHLFDADLDDLAARLDVSGLTGTRWGPRAAAEAQTR